MTDTENENRSYSRGKVKKVMFNDRCGYALVYYDPISDFDAKIDPLNLKNLPYTIPLNTKVLKSLKPAGKPGKVSDIDVPKRVNVPGEYESAKQFRERKLIESKIAEIRESCFNCRRYFQKAEKFDLKRRELISPRLKNKLRGKSSDEICDFLVDDVMQNIDYVYDRNVAPKQKKSYVKKCDVKKIEQQSTNLSKVAAKLPKPVKKIQVKTPELVTLDEEEKDDSRKNSICEKCQCQCAPKPPKVEQVKKSPEPQATTKEPEKSLEEILKVSERPKFEQLSTNTLRRQRRDITAARAYDELLFEINYGRVLRKLKNEIRRLREEYS